MAALAAGVGAAGCAGLPAADAWAVYSAHEAAIGRGDVAGAASWLDDDARYVAGPLCPPARPCVGKDAVRKGFVEWAATLPLQITPVRVDGTQSTASMNVLWHAEFGPAQVGEETLHVALEARWPELGTLAIERVRGVDEVRVRDGKIVALTFKPDLGDAQTAAFYRHRAATAQLRL